MNQFVHGRMHHFMAETDGDGNDLGGGQDDDQQSDDQSDDNGDDDADDQTDLPDDQGDDDSDTDSDADDDSGELVVTIAGEKPEPDDEATAPKWVKDLRKSHREAQKRIKELEAAQAKANPASAAPVLGKKPSMSDDDIDYDEEKFEAALAGWYDKKREIDQHQAKQQQEQEKAASEWQERLGAYQKARGEMKVKDFEEAEAVVMDLFDQTQQGLIIDVMDNPAMLIYALGRNRKSAEKLAAITKPTKFLRELSRLEDTKLKIQKGKTAPPPEKTISGTGKVSGSVDSTLERLRAEADKTGDMSKVLAYKREQRNKKK